MAKDKKASKKKVEPKSEGEVEWFNDQPSDYSKLQKQMSEDIKKHPKFDKFKKGND